MRLLGIGYEEIRKFCSIRDLSKMFTKTIYQDKHLLCQIIVSKTVASILFSDAAIEKNLMTKAENISNHPFLLYYLGGSNGDGM